MDRVQNDYKVRLSTALDDIEFLQEKVTRRTNTSFGPFDDDMADLENDYLSTPAAGKSILEPATLAKETETQTARILAQLDQMSKAQAADRLLIQKLLDDRCSTLPTSQKHGPSSSAVPVQKEIIPTNQQMTSITYKSFNYLLNQYAKYTSNSRQQGFQFVLPLTQFLSPTVIQVLVDSEIAKDTDVANGSVALCPVTFMELANKTVIGTIARYLRPLCYQSFVTCLLEFCTLFKVQGQAEEICEVPVVDFDKHFSAPLAKFLDELDHFNKLVYKDAKAEEVKNWPIYVLGKKEDPRPGMFTIYLRMFGRWEKAIRAWIGDAELRLPRAHEDFVKLMRMSAH